MANLAKGLRLANAEPSIWVDSDERRGGVRDDVLFQGCPRSDALPPPAGGPQIRSRDVAEPSHATIVGIGAGVLAVAALPGAIGAYQIKDTAQGTFSNGWLRLAVVLWLVGNVLVLGTAAHAVCCWVREQPVRTTEPSDLAGE
jgi:hypothetical protein